MTFKEIAEYEKRLKKESASNIEPEIKDFFRAEESTTKKKKSIYHFSGTLKNLKKILKI